jgi:MFS superfamily sulfate permease-like transporter
VTVALAIACALVLGGVLSELPEATLGCMVIVAVLGLIRPAEIRRLWRLDRVEFWVAAITAASGLLLGLLAAVFVGVVLTLFLVLRELDRIGLTELQPTEGDEDVEVAGERTRRVEGLLVMRVDGPLYTANIRSVNRKLVAALDAAAPVEVLLVDMSAVAALTVTVIDEVAGLERELDARGAVLWTAALPPMALETARKTPRWAELDELRRVFPTSLAAVRAFRQRSR